jgi:exodeoxyribonuclease VII large subunit
MQFHQGPDDLDEPALLTDPAGDWRAKVPTVSQLTRRLRGHLENTFFDVWVRGEISGFRKPSSGHCYLVVKDAGAQIKVCLFRPTMSRLKFALEDGMEVLIHGRVTVYEPRGEYQLVGDAVEPFGAGALQKAFEQLKLKLSAEGLFEPSRKKTLPLLPQRIGVVTSPTGAAVRDILKVLHRRFAEREILIFPASVQGDRAAGEIVRALKLVESWNAQEPARAVEVLIIGRGGGSIEDLWPFNEESVARAIANCPLPTISAVGHEVDFTIADFVADVRAPTPSAAAELVLPKKEELVFQVQTHERRMVALFRKQLDQWKLHVGHLSRRLISPQQRLGLLRTEFQKASVRLQAAIDNSHRLRRSRLTGATGRLDALSPLRVLGRGYSITTLENGEVVRQADQVHPGDTIHSRFANSQISSRVVAVAQTKSSP